MDKIDANLEHLLSRERETRIICAELNNFTDLKPSLDVVIKHIRDLTGCEAVSIRLHENDDYPYYVYTGFLELFIQKENSLCSGNGCNQASSCQLACLCGNVISGRTDDGLPCFTSYGSFWTNNSPNILKLVDQHPHLFKHIRGHCITLGYLSMAMIPIKDRGRRIGLIQINDKKPGMFTEVLILYLEMIGSQIGLAVRNSLTHTRLVEHEQKLKRLQAQLVATNKKLKEVLDAIQFDLDAASKIQRQLLPPEKIIIEGIETAWWFEPCAEVSGDLLNVFHLDTDHIGLYVLDVSGHGVQAALLAVSLSRMLTNWDDTDTLVTTGQGTVRPPGEVLNLLNRRFQIDDSSNQYFTIIYGVLNTSTGVFRYAKAGHQPLLVCAPDGTAEFMVHGSHPVGWQKDVIYTDCELKPAPGTRLFLFTDGIIEAKPGVKEEMFGYDRLASLVKQERQSDLASCVDSAARAVHTWLDGRPPGDDMTLLALEIK